MPFIYDPLSEFGLQDYVERARDWKGDAGELKHLVREIADAYISNHDDIALAIASSWATVVYHAFRRPRCTPTSPRSNLGMPRLICSEA